jgi:hypothetical protein
VRKAELQAVTNNFEQDKTLFSDVIEEFNAVIKFEQFSGAKKPYRQLRVRVAVPVERFEEMIDELKGIGTLTSIDIQTIDKIEDFRKILAQKKALEAHRDALQRLRDGGGEVDKLIQLEERILGIEKEIHQLGVQLDDFVQKETFGNVEFTLVEKMLKEEGFGAYLNIRIWKSVGWALQTYFYCLMVYAVGYLTVLSIKILFRR